MICRASSGLMDGLCALDKNRVDIVDDEDVVFQIAIIYMGCKIIK
jgi:hypothetical protein